MPEPTRTLTTAQAIVSRAGARYSSGFRAYTSAP